MTSLNKFSKAKEIFKIHGGILNTVKAIRMGINDVDKILQEFKVASLEQVFPTGRMTQFQPLPLQNDRIEVLG